ncbi:MAG: hypothetical protein HOV81_37240 [Kofleriaceae bacterium]|nr:hypothetical protein [Kofleriaceae bacterium]
MDAAPPDTGPSLAARGAYIVNTLANCKFCHTPKLPNGQPDLDKNFSGVDCWADIDSPTGTDDGGSVGCLSTRNLTPDPTGLGNVTDQQIKDAFLNGIRTDGKKLVPVMPWWILHNMTDDDADAVVAYLRSIPPIAHQVKPNQPPWSLYNDGVPDILPDPSPLAVNTIPMPGPGANMESAMRGRYLASVAGLCIDCHTPETSPNSLQLDSSRFFAGGRLFSKEQLGLLDPSYPNLIATGNLTTDATGLKGWTKDQIKAALSEGRDRDNNSVCASAHGNLTSSYASLEPQDLEDIVEYISHLPAVANDVANDPNVANCGLPALPLAVGAPETGAQCDDTMDNDGDGTVNDGCPETGTDCSNTADDDGDGVPNDGCPVACGNCAGPPVP